MASNGKLQIEQVKDGKDLLKFIDFPFKLYRDDPSWVPPLIEERRDFFDPRKNPFFEHARCQLFVARRCIRSSSRLTDRISSPSRSAMLPFASIAVGSSGWLSSKVITRPRPSSPRRSLMSTGSERSNGVTPSLSATYVFASPRRIPRAICMRATRSPAARIPPRPEAHPCATGMANMSPDPTYKPSRRRMSTQAREARETASTGL